MKAVAVACGGRGTRLGEPGQKCLVDLHGRPFLHHKLDQLAGHNATEFHLLVAYDAWAVYASVGTTWDNIPVIYHHDNGTSHIHAHHTAPLPYVHFYTYGDTLLNVPLRHAARPYTYSNNEYEDAGVSYCWGSRLPRRHRHTDAIAYHCNTPEDLEITRAAVV